MPKHLPLLAACWLLATTLSAQMFRYTNTVFPAATVTPNIVYGNAPGLTGANLNQSINVPEDLIMDIYRPAGDAFTNRPAIVFVHSGGFITGSRTHDDMVAACDSFARRGYVTATIDYRQGFYLLSDVEMHGTRAVYRGIQDGRSAVRFLRANAATYGIDPSRVYMVGSSAGSFIALHSIYMDNSEKPAFAGPVSYSNLIPPFFYSGPDLGPLDIGNHLGQLGTPNAIVAMWGALQGTDLIQASDNVPAFLIHGTNDNTVPFDVGPPFSLFTFPDVYGSLPISNTLAGLGNPNYETYFVPGEGHEFHGTSNGTWTGSGGNAYWDEIVARSGQFLWRQHKPIADFSYAANGLGVGFTDESFSPISWKWDFGDGQTSTLTNPNHSYAAAGTYWVSLYVENANHSWDTIGYAVTVEAPLPVIWGDPLRAESTANARDVRLSWSVLAGHQHARFVVEHSRDGQTFSTLGELTEGPTGIGQHDYLHAGAGPGRHLYRIRQIDVDGRFDLSNLAEVTLGEVGELIAFPNPTSGVVRLTSEVASSSATPLRVFDVLGRQQLRVIVSGPRPTVDLGHLPPGLYWIAWGEQRVKVRVR